MQELVLNKFIVDCVRAVQTDQVDDSGYRNKAQVQLVSYVVLAETADQAIQRFFNDEAGVVMYEGDIVDQILVGIQAASTEVIDV